MVGITNILITSFLFIGQELAFVQVHSRPGGYTDVPRPPGE